MERIVGFAPRTGLPSPPRWLLNLLKPPPPQRFVGKHPSGTIERRLECAIRRVAESPPGTRNDELNKQAHLLGRMIASEGVSFRLAEARLTEAAQACGLDLVETRNTIAFGNHPYVRRLAQRPRSGFPARGTRRRDRSLNDEIYPAINNGVYRAGFATTQAAYEEAFDRLFAMLDTLEHRLSSRAFLVGDRITEADWRLFTTLIRFDAVYHGHFKCNRSRLTDFPELWDYTRTLYQIPGVAETVRLDQVKTHYYGSHRTINPTGIVPKGPAIDLLAPTKRRPTLRVAPNDARSLEGDREARRRQP